MRVCLEAIFKSNSLQAHLTYRGASGKSYSFYVCFSEKCLLESDDCVVDVSDDNVVVLLTKDGRGLWDKFEAGLNISQTKVGWNCTTVIVII